MNPLRADGSVLDNFRRYLLSKRWSQTDHPNTRIRVFEPAPNSEGGYTSIVLPSSLEFRDAQKLIDEALHLVAQQENLQFETLVDRIWRWDRDVLRSRLFKLIGDEDSLPLGVAADAVSGIKEFLGYAAYTHTYPRPFFDRAGSISADFVRLCRFAHTFKGSFGLTVECPITVPPILPMDGNEPPVPFERQIFERVANGMITLRKSVASDSIDPLLAGYTTGFSANMCRKLADIYERADGRRIEYDISWSPQLKSTCERTWEKFVFDGKAFEFSRAAAGELEKSETFPDSKVEGRIVALKSEMPPGLDEQAEFEHIVTMVWEREKDQTVRIRIALSSDEYKHACDAHKSGRAIRVFGVPEKAGKFWTLTKAHSFAVLL